MLAVGCITRDDQDRTTGLGDRQTQAVGQRHDPAWACVAGAERDEPAVE
jgi:hypothetical protein